MRRGIEFILEEYDDYLLVQLVFMGYLFNVQATMSGD